MIAMVKNFGRWETQAPPGEEGVSRDLIRKMITVYSRRLSKKDYEGIAAVIKEIPLINFKTPPEDSKGSEANVNSPVVTAQTKPPQLSNHSRNNLETPRHSSSQGGTSRSYPLAELTQLERCRTTTRISPTSSRRRSVLPEVKQHQGHLDLEVQGLGHQPRVREYKHFLSVLLCSV
jgi:hypothetical protein